MAKHYKIWFFWLISTTLTKTGGEGMSWDNGSERRKMYDINFYQPVLAREYSKKQKQLVWTWKCFELIGIVLTIEQKIKSFNLPLESFA